MVPTVILQEVSFLNHRGVVQRSKMHDGLRNYMQKTKKNPTHLIHGHFC